MWRPQAMKSPKLQKHHEPQLRTLADRGVLTTCLALAILCLFAFTAPSASAKDIQRLPHEPNKPKVNQVYFNTTDNHEYIYNGEEWVPHDASIDTYVLKKYKKSKGSKNPSHGDGSDKTKDASDNQGAAK